MLVLKLNVRNQRLSKFNSPVIASNSAGYLHCQFNFLTNDWDRVSAKMANFSYRGRNYPVLVDDNNLCEVPVEIIKPNSTFKVSVFGGGITTNTLKYDVEDSGIVPADDESISMKYYNEIINKLTAQIDDLNETKADNIVVDKETNTIQLSANGMPIGDTVDLCSCGIKSFDVDENDNITITLMDGRIIDLGTIIGASGVVFVPHISEDKILTWTNNGDLENPAPVDLNAFDEWIELGDGGETPSQYTWGFM
jgi:hypothetical protein